MSTAMPLQHCIELGLCTVIPDDGSPPPPVPDIRQLRTILSKYGPLRAQIVLVAPNASHNELDTLAQCKVEWIFGVSFETAHFARSALENIADQPYRIVRGFKVVARFFVPTTKVQVTGIKFNDVPYGGGGGGAVAHDRDSNNRIKALKGRLCAIASQTMQHYGVHKAKITGASVPMRPSHSSPGLVRVVFETPAEATLAIRDLHGRCVPAHIAQKFNVCPGTAITGTLLWLQCWFVG